MTWYIQIPPLNGRQEFLSLAEKLMVKGFEDRVEYHSGGWKDDEPRSVYPHLKFENEDDALAYTLAYGGKIRKTIPLRKSVVEVGD